MDELVVRQGVDHEQGEIDAARTALSSVYFSELSGEVELRAAREAMVTMGLIQPVR